MTTPATSDDIQALLRRIRALEQTLSRLQTRDPGAGINELRISGDVYPLDIGNGLGKRVAEAPGYTPTAHFTGNNVAPTGYGWIAAAPFVGTPDTVVYNRFSDYLMAYCNGATDRAFLSKTITTGGANWQTRGIMARVRTTAGTEFGMRVDLPGDSNYAELMLSGVNAQAHAHLQWRSCVAGVLTSASVNFYLPINQYAILYLLCYWTGATYNMIGYTVGEDGMLLGIPNFNSGNVAWPGTGAGRVGLTLRNVGAAPGGIGLCDWVMVSFT